MLLYLAIIIGGRRRSHEDANSLEIEQGRPWQGWGLGVAAVGLALILAQIEGVTSGTVVLGSGIALFGCVLLLRRWTRIERSSVAVTRGHHLFGFPVWTRNERFGRPVTVSLTGDLPPHVELTSSDASTVVVLKPGSSEEALREGKRVARFLNTSLQDPFRARREEIDSARG